MGFSGTSIQGHLSRGLIDVMRLTLLLLVSYRPLAHLCNTDPISASCEAPVAWIPSRKLQLSAECSRNVLHSLARL